MNEFQARLYKELTELVKASEAFYCTDHFLDGIKYCIFLYRLASYTDFQQPSALEARGITFRVNPDGEVELVCLPMGKFFNLNENPFTMNLDLSRVERIEPKADGSLISTFIHQGELLVKTKGSFSSEQALRSMEWINIRPFFKEYLSWITQNGYTVNMEWVSPDNQIVLRYEEPQLKVLNIRNNLDGSYLNVENTPLVDWYSKVDLDGKSVVEFINQVPSQIGIEGFVGLMEDGLRFKIKTDWYLALHKSKDSISSDRRLYEAVLSEAIDDLRVMFHTDGIVINRIDNMQEFVTRTYNNLANDVEMYYQSNRDLPRKEYAIQAQKQLNHHKFSLAMQRYSGKEVDYKQYMLKKWKEFGVKDNEFYSS